MNILQYSMYILLAAMLFLCSCNNNNAVEYLPVESEKVLVLPDNSHDFAYKSIDVIDDYTSKKISAEEALRISKEIKAELDSASFAKNEELPILFLSNVLDRLINELTVLAEDETHSPNQLTEIREDFNSLLDLQ